MEDSKRTQLFRDTGWSLCFAQAEGLPGGTRVAILASNCYGHPVMFLYDLGSSTRQRLDDAGADLLRAAIKKRYGNEAEGDLLSWVKRESAIEAYRKARAAK